MVVAFAFCKKYKKIIGRAKAICAYRKKFYPQANKLVLVQGDRFCAVFPFFQAMKTIAE